MDRVILHNALRTPDGTVIESRHRHDYVTHDDANGKRYMIDGGLDYIRSSAHGDEEYLTVYDDASHNWARMVVTWGTRGKNGDEPLRYVPVAQMTTDHIQACLETQDRMYPQVRKVMENELEWRGNRFSEWGMGVTG